jgi:hypothetical protein
MSPLSRVTYPSGSRVNESNSQVPLTELPYRERAPFPETSTYLSESLVNPLQVSKWVAYGERCPFPEPSFTHLLILKKISPPSLSKSLVKEPPSMFPQQGPCGERCSASSCNGLFVHLELLESPVMELSYKMGGNMWSPSAEPHVGRRPTYNWVRLGSPRGSFITLLSLPQCHAAFSMISFTLAWVDKMPVSQRVSCSLSTGYPFHTCHPSHVTQSTNPHNSEVRTRGWIYGRQVSSTEQRH